VCRGGGGGGGGGGEVEVEVEVEVELVVRENMRLIRVEDYSLKVESKHNFVIV
jgi:hypothetical protein